MHRSKHIQNPWSAACYVEMPKGRTATCPWVRVSKHATLERCVHFTPERDQRPNILLPYQVSRHVCSAVTAAASSKSTVADVCALDCAARRLQSTRYQHAPPRTENTQNPVLLFWNHRALSNWHTYDAAGCNSMENVQQVAPSGKCL